MQKDKIKSFFKTTRSKAVALIALVVLILAVVSFSTTGGTFAKWSQSISKVTETVIKIGDWYTEGQPKILTEENLPDSQVGEDFSKQLEAVNGDGATWTLSNGSLPDGLILSPDGLLSGNPTSEGVYSFQISVKNFSGKDERTFNLTVVQAPPIFDEEQILPDGLENNPYPLTKLKATGTSNTFELESGSLPSGLNLSLQGVIDGEPTDFGLSAFTVKVSNDGGSDTKDFTIDVKSDFPTITTNELPGATKGEYYNQKIAGAGSSPTYAITKGSLPDGLKLHVDTGIISGYPIGHGVSEFSVSKTNSKGSVSKDFTIDVLYSYPTITTGALPIVRKGVPYTAEIEGNGEESTHVISGGQLPDGLVLDSTTGVISGITAVTGDFDFEITKTNESGTAVKSFSLKSLLAVPLITNESGLPHAYNDVYYEAENTAVGEEIVWSAENLPDGLAINPTTGVISGKTTSIGSRYIYVIATNSGGQHRLQMPFFVKDAPPVITSESIPDGEVNQPYSALFSADGDGVFYRIGGTLPPGLIFNVGTGEIAGLPTKSGTYNVVFYATNSGGTVSKSFDIFIETDGPTITTKTLPDAMQGVSYSLFLQGKGESAQYAVTNGSLPPNISLNATTGRLSGSTSGHGNYNFTVTKTNSKGRADQELNLKAVYQTPTLTGSGVLTSGKLDVAYNYQLTGVGNGSTYKVIEGKMPEGLSLDDTTGLISGKPLEVGAFKLTIEKTNESGSATKEYALNIIHVAPRMETKAFDPATIGVPYSMQIQAVGVDLVYSIHYGSLPAGLTLNPETGLISGTPTETKREVIRVRVTNSGGYADLLNTFASNEVAPIMNTTSLPSGMVGEPYYGKIEATGEALTYGIGNQRLPAGLSIDSETGVISGTPTSESQTSFNFVVQNSGGSASNLIPLYIAPQVPTITTESLPDGYTGARYSHNLTGDGTSNKFSIIKGELPPGMRINSISGTIDGTPTATARGDYTFTIQKSNVSGTVSKEFTLRISYISPTITNTTLIDGRLNMTYSDAIKGVGTSVVHSIIEGSLPPGLSLNRDNGAITGAPTATGEYKFTVLKSNLDGEASKELTITVKHVAPTITTRTLPNVIEGVHYEFALEGTGEESTYAITSGTLPEGINLDADTGVFSGVTTAKGQYILTVTKTNSGGVATRSMMMKVTIAPPVITTTSYPDPIVGVPYSFQIQATGESIAWSQPGGSGTLPPGLSLDYSTGVISGVPTTVGPRAFTIQATNSGGTAELRSSITVKDDASVNVMNSPSNAEQNLMRLFFNHQ